MAKSKKKSSKTTTSAEPDIAASAGAEAAYERFLAEARAVDAREVIPFRADALLAQHNVGLGAAAVLAEKTRLARELPGLDLRETAALPELALAVVYAAAQVDRKDTPKTDVRKRLARAQEVRALMLAAADSLALAGLVPARAVAKIREGRGAIDAAQDCVELAALFRKHAAAAKKTVVSAAQIKEAAELGTGLLETLKPRAAKTSRAATGDVKEAAAVRDRLWTLLVRRHDAAWRAGVWLFGRAAEESVPLLQARAAAKKKSAPAPEPGGGDA